MHHHRHFMIVFQVNLELSARLSRFHLGFLPQIVLEQNVCVDAFPVTQLTVSKQYSKH